MYRSVYSSESIHTSTEVLASHSTYQSVHSKCTQDNRCNRLNIVKKTLSDETLEHILNEIRTDPWPERVLLIFTPIDECNNWYKLYALDFNTGKHLGKINIASRDYVGINFKQALQQYTIVFSNKSIPSEIIHLRSTIRETLNSACLCILPGEPNENYNKGYSTFEGNNSSQGELSVSSQNSQHLQNEQEQKYLQKKRKLPNNNFYATFKRLYHTYKQSKQNPADNCFLEKKYPSRERVSDDNEEIRESQEGPEGFEGHEVLAGRDRQIQQERQTQTDKLVVQCECQTQVNSRILAIDVRKQQHEVGVQCEVQAVHDSQVQQEHQVNQTCTKIENRWEQQLQIKRKYEQLVDRYQLAHRKRSTTNTTNTTPNTPTTPTTPLAIIELIKELNKSKVKSARDTNKFFHMAELNKLKICIRPALYWNDLSTWEYDMTKKCTRYHLDCFLIESKYIGSIILEEEKLKEQLKIHRKLLPYVEIIDDVYKITPLPAFLSSIFRTVCKCFHMDFIYDNVGEFLFSLMKKHTYKPTKET